MTILSKIGLSSFAFYKRLPLGICLFIFVLSASLSGTVAYGVIIEKVVAYVGDEAITLTDLCNYWKSLREVQPDININDALKAIVNRKIIIHKARELNLSGGSEDELIGLYIRFAIKPKVMVTKEEVKGYYQKYHDKLKGAPLESIEPQIITILKEKKTNELLKEHIEALKKRMSVGVSGPVDGSLCDAIKN